MPFVAADIAVYWLRPLWTLATLRNASDRPCWCKSAAICYVVIDAGHVACHKSLHQPYACSCAATDGGGSGDHLCFSLFIQSTRRWASRYYSYFSNVAAQTNNKHMLGSQPAQSRVGHADYVEQKPQCTAHYGRAILSHLCQFLLHMRDRPAGQRWSDGLQCGAK